MQEILPTLADRHTIWDVECGGSIPEQDSLPVDFFPFQGILKHINTIK